VGEKTDCQLPEQALTKCEEEVEELKEENAQLRNAAETFGELAERLNAVHAGSDGDRRQTPREQAAKSQPDKDLSH
jgi:hypothetical protein